MQDQFRSEVLFDALQSIVLSCSMQVLWWMKKRNHLLAGCPFHLYFGNDDVEINLNTINLKKVGCMMTTRESKKVIS